MTDARSPSGRLGRAGAGLRALWTAPLRSQTYLNLAYLALSLPLGLAYFGFLAVVAPLGVALTVLVVGVVVLAAGLVAALVLARFEGWLASVLLGVDIEFDPDLPGETPQEQFGSLVTSRQTVAALLYLPSKLVLGIVSFVALVSSLGTAVALVFVPLYYDEPGVEVGLILESPAEVHSDLSFGWDYLLVGFDAVISVGSWQVDTLGEALVVSGLGLVFLVFALFGLNLLARFSGWYARFVLDGSVDLPAVARRAL